MSAYPRQLPLWQEPAYTPPRDFVGPVVDKPGPDCSHPGRLCVVNDLDVCPWALTPWMGRDGYHPTRCGRENGDDWTDHTEKEIGAVLGMTKEGAGQFVNRALEKFARNMRRMQLGLGDK